jgi:hypothetical protein
MQEGLSVGRKKKGAPVVIVRKDKRLNKTGHLLGFALTGGMSSVYTATKAATNAGYNARTRKLMEQAEDADETSQASHPLSVPQADKGACPSCGAYYVLAQSPDGRRTLVKGHSAPSTGQRCALSNTAITPT